MRATGIVRRVDDLGRIVIPKEIRRTLGIREGEPLEIYLENDAVIFRRYSFRLSEEVKRLGELVEANYNGSPANLEKLSGILDAIYDMVKADEEEDE